MKKHSSLICIIVFCLSLQAQVQQVRDTILMGCRFKITVVDTNEIDANVNINGTIAEIVRIENLISDWIPTSQISQVNTYAGIKPIKVDKEVFDLTQRAIYYSEITHGAFDISFAAMENIWNFNDFMDEIPTQAAIKKAIAKVGYQNIVLNSVDTTIFLREKGMKIGFGSIGKGYAADKGREFLLSKGVESGIVDASGDLTTFGKPIDSNFWNIGITNPVKRYKLVKVLKLKTNAVTTSGDYEKFVLINNVRYSHIINPKTGWPSTGLTSVTIVGPSAEMANAFSTSIMVMGVKKGHDLLKKHPDYGGLFITNSGKIVKSKNFNKA